MCRSCAILALAHSADSNEVAGHFRKPMKFKLNVVSNGQTQNWIYVPLMCSGSKIVMECLPKIQNQPHPSPVTRYPPQRLRRQSTIQNSKSKIQNFLTPLPVTRHSAFAANPKSKIFLPPIHPVAVFATTLGSGFVEMILHLPIQNLLHSLLATASRRSRKARRRTFHLSGLRFLVSSFQFPVSPFSSPPSCKSCKFDSLPLTLRAASSSLSSLCFDSV